MSKNNATPQHEGCWDLHTRVSETICLYKMFWNHIVDAE